MRYLVLCCDYDGTLANDGRVLPETSEALRRLSASGRRIVLVTGRELDELLRVCPAVDPFAYIVAENGALLFEPSTGKETLLGERPPDAFVNALSAQGVGPISVGRVIVATWEPHEKTVLETIKQQGLELQVIFNKGAVMVLPAGVNKATGLRAALGKMGLSPHNAVGIGDAENDHALLSLCECGVAVANALPTLKQAATFVTAGARGAGVQELIDALLADDLASHESQLTKHHLLIGADSQEKAVRIPPYGQTILVTGEAEAEARALVTTFLAQLTDCKYTFCVIDPHGRYGSLEQTVMLGSDERAPAAEEVLKLFEDPDESGVINLACLSSDGRHSFIDRLLPGLAELRGRTGRPHWLVGEGELGGGDLRVKGRGQGETFPSVLQVVSRPGILPAPFLKTVDLVIAVGKTPQSQLEEFCRMAATPIDRTQWPRLAAGEALALAPRDAGKPFVLRVAT